MRATTFTQDDQAGVCAPVETPSQAAQNDQDGKQVRRWLEDEAIYRRTTAGQREVVFDERPLAPISRRLLLLVNGETPLRNLFDLLDEHDQRAAESVLQLADERLIELCDPLAQRAR